jgi:hypothetical protein
MSQLLKMHLDTRQRCCLLGILEFIVQVLALFVSSCSEHVLFTYMLSVYLEISNCIN